MHVSVENNPNVVKDSASKAVLATDVAALQAHRKQKQNNQRLEAIEAKIDDLSSKLDALLDAVHNIISTIQDNQ